jgi:hypothetical protein
MSEPEQEPEIHLMAFAKFLKKRLIAEEMTPEMLADQSGISIDSITEMLEGKPVLLELADYQQLGRTLFSADPETGAVWTIHCLLKSLRGAIEGAVNNHRVEELIAEIPEGLPPDVDYAARKEIVRRVRDLSDPGFGEDCVSRPEDAVNENIFGPSRRAYSLGEGVELAILTGVNFSPPFVKWVRNMSNYEFGV